MTRYYVMALTVGGWIPVGEVQASDEQDAYRQARKREPRLPKERLKVEQMA